MSIEKDYDIYIAVCDICGDDIGPFEDFYDAVDAKKAAGWRSRKDAHGDYTLMRSMKASPPGLLPLAPAPERLEHPSIGMTVPWLSVTVRCSYENP